MAAQSLVSKRLKSLSKLLLATTFALTLTITSGLVVGGNGKGNGGGGNGGGGDPPPPPPPSDPPPVQYRLTYIDNIWPGFGAGCIDINDSGVIVGGATAFPGCFMATPNAAGGWDAVDLNNLGATWIDLDTGNQTNDWLATYESRINNSGQVGIKAEHAVTGAWRPALLQWENGTPQFYLMPTSGLPTRRVDINDQGVIVAGETFNVVFTPWSGYTPTVINALGGHPRINNLGIVGNSSYNGTSVDSFFVIPTVNPDGTYDYNSASSLIEPYMDSWDINDLGQVLASQKEITEGNGKKKTVVQAASEVLYEVFGGNRQLIPVDRGFAINEVGDVVGNVSLYAERNGTSYLLTIDDLIVNKGANWTASFNAIELTDSTPLTDPEGTGFGMICGWVTPDGGTPVGAVLTPETYVAP